MGNFNQIPKLLTQLWELSTLIWEIIGVSLGFHWEIRIYFPCWEIILYLGNVFPNIGKHCGKSLGHVWDFSGSQYTILTLGNQCNMLGTFFPMLENIMGNCCDFFGIFSRKQILVSSWETNFSFWEFLSQYWKILWKSLGVDWDFQRNQYCNSFLVGKYSIPR